MPARWIETKMIAVDELTSFPGNARRGKIPVIRESLRRNGQYRSLVVRQDGPALVVLAGNQTMQALIGEGHTEARCEIVECSDSEARRINLVDNRANDLSTDDPAALAELLAQIDDYAGTGFTSQEAEKLLNTGPKAGDAATDAELYMVWGVIIECGTEAEQVELLTRLSAEGLNVRALVG